MFSGAPMLVESMCGIAGAFTGRNDLTDERRLVERLVAHQIPRGPDYQSVESFSLAPGGAILGHDRLSIVDLSPASNQPFSDPEGRFALVYNGEIYNYREVRDELRSHGVTFRTEGDTEVVLEAFRRWGPLAAHRFVGMFAFAILEIPARKLWLVRDRFGVKPCFYHQSDGVFRFASSATPFARAFSLSGDDVYLDRGRRGWIYETDDGRTAYRDLHAVPPGSYLEVDLSTKGPVVALHRWYRLAEERTEGSDPSPETLRALLLDAVRLRFRADVPAAISLSGGLDSSAIAAAAVRLGHRPVAFTYGHPDRPETEGPEVARLAKHLGLEVHYIDPTPEEFAAAFWKCLAAQEAPFAGPSVVGQYLVFEKMRAAGFKLALGGQGGDEAFLGYRKFQVFQLREAWRRKRWADTLRFGVGFAKTLAHELPAWRSYAAGARRYSAKTVVSRATTLRERQIDDYERLSLPTLLRYEDRNSMAHSVESRLPFLDHRLVEWAVGLPDDAKIRDGFGKWILRRAVEDWLPRGCVFARSKNGFRVGFAAAALGPGLRARLGEASLTDDALAGRPGLFAEAVHRLWSAQEASPGPLTEERPQVRDCQVEPSPRIIP